MWSEQSWYCSLRTFLATFEHKNVVFPSFGHWILLNHTQKLVTKSKLKYLLPNIQDFQLSRHPCYLKNSISSSLHPPYTFNFIFTSLHLHGIYICGSRLISPSLTFFIIHSIPPYISGIPRTSTGCLPIRRSQCSICIKITQRTLFSISIVLWRIEKEPWNPPKIF